MAITVKLNRFWEQEFSTSRTAWGFVGEVLAERLAEQKALAAQVFDQIVDLQLEADPEAEAMREARGPQSSKPKEKRYDDRWDLGVRRLADYYGDIIDVEDAEGLEGTVVDVFSLVHGTPVQRRARGDGLRGLAHSKLCVAMEQADGSVVIVNVISAFHREIGNITDPRLEALAAALPKGQAVNTSEEFLTNWFTQKAGLRRRG